MIGLYSPDLPPVPGGVADQTLMLARALERRGTRCAVLGARGDPERFAPIPVRLGVTPPGLHQAVRDLGLRSLFVQYVPFLYARRGVAPTLCPALRRVRRAGVRVALFVHEPFVPFTRLPWLVTGVFQRLQLRCLVRASERVYTPVPRFAAICRGYLRDPAAVTLAPIGANFEPSALARDEARGRLGLAPGTIAIGVFSPAASGYLPGWVRHAMAALADRPAVRWIAFGFGSERLFGAGVPANVTALGTLDRGAVADVARALDLFVAPYQDGLTMRRGGAMLALRSGVALVSSTGQLFDTSLAHCAACEPTAEAFTARVAELVTDAAARQEWTRRAAASGAVSSIDALADIVIRDLA